MSLPSNVSTTVAGSAGNEGFCHREVEWTDQVVRGRIAPTQESDGAISWRMQRNCCMKPGHMLCVLMLIALPSTLTGIGFYLMGVTWVTLFCGLELFVLALVFIIYARNAADDEWVRVQGEHIEVQVRQGSRIHFRKFHRQWVTVSMPQRSGGLLVLRESGQSVAIGRHIPRHLRGDFYRALWAEIFAA